MRKIFTSSLILLSVFAIAQNQQSQKPNILFALPTTGAGRMRVFMEIKW
ncbi:hypothetical protein [Niabella ginsengisoli]|uniref:Tripartite tricarboxylate transporter substrate binding protein n=1 Tax=Niabella ginsengisoli TaxID=522298 RepID=A0ABS9SQJ2_9BACT|nr:hypothetical protein [Niabella ginsengisoli]MCH5600642.1 hypothetical protein [Niabella ginsengisoli]